MTFVMYALCRVPPGLLYLWALCFWQRQIAALPATSIAVFHILGLSFGAINFAWIILLCSWYAKDMKHLKQQQQPQQQQQFQPVSRDKLESKAIAPCYVIPTEGS
jgi:hypothetical protein